MGLYHPKRAISGPVGPQGPSGEIGPTGLQGPSGAQGISGVQGIQGTTGIQGPQGLQGSTGIQGPQGPQGASGIAGPTGLQGPTGIQGPTGLQGPQGAAGTGGVSSFLELSDVSYSNFVGRGQSLFYNGSNLFSVKAGGGSIINVMDFGASGDSITDDRLAIQRATESINNGTGNVLYFPYSTGRYIVKVDTDPSTFLFAGMNNSYPIIKLTRRGTKVQLDNGVHIEVVGNFSLSGTNPVTIAKAPLFGIYTNDCVIDGGKYSLSTGNGIIYQGSGVNGYPIYYGISYNTTWNNITFSGFAGGSLNSGLFVPVTGDSEYTDFSKFYNCKFYDWGGGWNDTLITHQSHTLFDNCLFSHRETTGVVGSIKEHGSALVVRNLVTDIKYNRCIFKNIGGGLGDLAHPIDILSTGIYSDTYIARGISITDCLFINNRKLIPIQGSILAPILVNNRFIYDVTGVHIRNLLNQEWNNGWYISGGKSILINNQDHIHIKIDTCALGIITDNVNCKITSLRCSGILLGHNFVREDKYFTDLNYPEQRINILVDSCNTSLITNNTFKYDNNIGILTRNSLVGTATADTRSIIGNLFSYNHFISTTNFPSGYPIYVSGSTRNSFTSNYYYQTGTLSNHSIYVNSSNEPFSHSGNYINLYKGNIFFTPNATGGLGPIYINDKSIKNTIQLSLEKGIKAANLVKSSAGNKIVFNLFNMSGWVSSGSFSRNEYNVTGNL